MTMTKHKWTILALSLMFFTGCMVVIYSHRAIWAYPDAWPAMRAAILWFWGFLIAMVIGEKLINGKGHGDDF